jgi:hypothetical protein
MDLSAQGQERETTNDLFAFLTTEPNAIVGAIHSKAMPDHSEGSRGGRGWTSAPAPEGLEAARAAAGRALRIVLRGD